jgi:NADH:ubiquinone oxidoreductase subunit K
MFRLSRDPVILLNLVAVVIMTFSDFIFHLTDNQQTWLNGTALAVMNLIAAFRVHDGQVVALTGLAKACIALAVGFGLHLAVHQQATLMDLVAVAGMFFLRTQVAPINAPTPPALAEPVVEVSGTSGNVGTPPARVAL